MKQPPFRSILSVLLPLAWAAAGLAAQEPTEGAEANEGCYACHSDPEEVMEFGDGAEVSIGLDKRAFLESPHGRFDCTVCHLDLDVFEHMSLERGPLADYRRGLVQRCVACHGEDGGDAEIDPSLRPAKTIAGTLHPETAENAPLCTSCHSPHAAARGERMRATISHTCAECHESTYAAFAGSAHGAGVLDPTGSDAPACVDCHHGHSESGNLLTERNVRLGQPCMGCHSDTDMMERHGISTSVVSTYLNDFHGVSVRFYDEEGGEPGLPTLVCADCHGVHDVAPMSQANIAAMKGSLLETCQQCHEDASESFPDAWLSHYEPSLKTAPLVWLVKIGYWVFIPFVILGLTMQIFAHLVLFPRRQRKSGKQPAKHHGPKIEPGDERKTVKRFGRRHRLEHLLVMMSFVLLLLTGLPQKFWDHDWAAFVTSMFGGIDMMRAIHRVTGITFTALCVIHLATAITGVLTHRTGMTMVPTAQDFRDAWINLRFYVGLGNEQPRFDRYDYRQKFEYWGMIVGSLVMIASGFVLYFPILFAELLPGQLIPAAKMAHTYEAMMALLTIIIWHMYGAHLNPDCYPIDRSMFTGKISLARMKHEHPLEYERLGGELAIEESGGNESTERESPAPASS